MKKILFALTLFTTCCFSQSGSLDLSFNPNDVGNGVGYGPNGSIDKIVVQQDGKIIILGTFTNINGAPRPGLARLNPDASLDTSFDVSFGGFTTFSLGYYVANGLADVALQSDGKIIVAGSFSSCQGYATNNIVRLNPDGSVDTSFVNIFSSSNTIYTIHVQTDDKILVSGEFTDFFGNLRIKVARLLADGNLDIGFNTSNGINGRVIKFIEQPDGKILIGGGFTAIQGYARGHVGRFNADGSIDLSFNSGGADNSVYDMDIQNDGKVVISGSFSKINNINRGGCARLNSNGVLDTSFQDPKIAGTPLSLKLLADGRIILGGTIISVNAAKVGNVACLNSDGSQNTATFSQIGTTNRVYCLTFQSDGKLLIGGSFLGYGYSGNSHIIRINTDWSFDNSFVFNGTGANSDVLVTESQSDGKILVGGNFTQYNNTNAFKLTRTNTDGSYDTTFNGWQGISVYDTTESKINAIKVQPDGKILIGGLFDTLNGNTLYNLTRLNSDGSKDNTFTSPLLHGSEVKSIYVQSDGKILIGCNGFLRLNSNGTVDSSFNHPGANGYVNDINIDLNGKIIIAGTFTNLGTPTLFPKTARINPNGTIDSSFGNNVIPDGTVNKVLLLPNDKIFIAGTFSLYSGNTVYDMAVLNSDSSLSSTFSSGVGISGGQTWTYQVFDAALQPNGKILIVGSFISYNGITQNRIARINQDGSLDSSFNVGGTGFNGTVTSCELTPDEKIIVCGSFTSYNGIGRNRIARLNNDGSLADDNFSVKDVTVYPNPFQNNLYINNPNLDVNKYELYDLLGHKIQGQSLESDEIKTENLAKGIYLLKLYTKDGFTLKKIIRE